MTRIITRSSLLAVIGVTIITAFLRLYHLDFNAIWIDEAATLRFSTGSFLDIWQYTAAGEFNPPGFHWLIHAVISILGVSEWSLRFLPMVAGVCTIPAVYAAATLLSSDRRVGILVAVLTALSPFHIFYSQEGRAYTAMLLCYTLGLVCYLRWIKTTTPPSIHAARPLLYLAMVWFGIAVWMHFYAAVAILPILIHLVYQHLLIAYPLDQPPHRVDRGWIYAPGLFALFLIPFLTIGPSLFARRTGMGMTWGADAVTMVTDIFVELAGFHILFALLFFLLAAVGLTRYRDQSSFALIPLTLVLPLVLSAILAPHMDLSVRYLIFLLPIFYTLVATGIVTVFDRIRMSNTNILVIATLLILVITVPTLTTYYTTDSKIDHRGAATALVEMTGDGDTVMLIPHTQSSAFTFYYNATADKTRYQTLTFDDPIPSDTPIWLVKAEVKEALDPDTPINRWLADRSLEPCWTSTWISIYRISEEI
ncbi:MAG: glycosyltransferase family 39 protein [candidate division Zixibacteria bacterium]|jgi:uncharacterized membrane protein|nr:glycosyltransferase family 39 protein [candidate division Zixibacteria bacterium]